MRTFRPFLYTAKVGVYVTSCVQMDAEYQQEFSVCAQQPQAALHPRACVRVRCRQS